MKTGKKSNSSRPESKNNLVDKRNGPQLGRLQQGRRAGGRRYTEWVRKVAYKARHIMCMPQGRRNRRV